MQTQVFGFCFFVRVNVCWHQNQCPQCCLKYHTDLPQKTLLCQLLFKIHWQQSWDRREQTTCHHHQLTNTSCWLSLLLHESIRAHWEAVKCDKHQWQHWYASSAQCCYSTYYEMTTAGILNIWFSYVIVRTLCDSWLDTVWQLGLCLKHYTKISIKCALLQCKSYFESFLWYF